MTTPLLDTNVYTSKDYTPGHSTLTNTIATAGTNRVVIVVIATETNTAHFYSTVSSFTTSTLSFTLRSRKQFIDSSGVYNNLETWWAQAPTQLSAEVITPVLSGAFPDNVTMSVCSVYGVGALSSPWDPNVSLPASATGSGAGTVAVSGVSTTKASTLMLALQSSRNGLGGTPTGGGWTIVNSVTEISGVSSEYFQDYYATFSIAQSGITVTLTSSSANWIMVIDALTSVAPGAGPGSFAALIG